jgi:hypothetical protein
VIAQSVGAPSLGVKRRSVKLTTHLPLVPRSKMHGAVPPFPQYASLAWCLVKHRDKFTLVWTMFFSMKFYSEARTVLGTCNCTVRTHWLLNVVGKSMTTLWHKMKLWVCLCPWTVATVENNECDSDVWTCFPAALRVLWPTFRVR